MNAVTLQQDIASELPGWPLRRQLIEQMSDAIIGRSGVLERSQADRVLQGNYFANASFVQMCEELFIAAGAARRGHVDIERAAGMGNADLPALMENVQNKAVMIPLAPEELQWRKLVTISRLSNFKMQSRVNATSISAPKEIANGGSLPRGSVSDFKEYLQAKTYGAEWVVEFQTLRNDDVSVLVHLPMAIRRRANKLVAEKVFSVLTGNPTLAQDATALFHTSHGNIVTAGAPPSVATLEVGFVAMGTQRAPSPTGNATADPGEQLYLEPRYLVVPQGLKGVANLLRVSMVDPWSPGAPNKMFDQFEVVSSPVLDAANPAGWFLVADPRQWPTIEAAFLDGLETPVILSDGDAGTRGIKYAVWHDFDCKAMDYRGTFYNDGA